MQTQQMEPGGHRRGIRGSWTHRMPPGPVACVLCLPPTGDSDGDTFAPVVLALFEASGLVVSLPRTQGSSNRCSRSTPWFEDEAIDIALDELRLLPSTAGLHVGILGVGPGAWWALHTAVRRRDRIAALVLCNVHHAPTGMAWPAPVQPVLLITGGKDLHAIRAGSSLLPALTGHKRTEVVPNAGADFAGWADQETVARLALAWFVQHLVPPHALA